MGEFFDSIHIKIPSVDECERCNDKEKSIYKRAKKPYNLSSFHESHSVKNVVKAITKIALNEGFIEAEVETLPEYNYYEREEESNCKRFLISYLQNGWITVYPSMRSCEKYAKEISKILGCCVIRTALYEGDTFCYWYFENGHLVDEYNSSIALSEKLSRSEVDKFRGDPEKLLYLMPENVTPEDLKDILLPKDSSEEEDDWEKNEANLIDGYMLMEKFTTTLGIGQACYSYYYACYDKELNNLKDEGFTHIAFTKKVNKKAGTKTEPSKPGRKKKTSASPNKNIKIECLE